jgi:hypothetical protein
MKKLSPSPAPVNRAEVAVSQMNPPLVCYWHTGRGSFVIQSRCPSISSWLRSLQSTRRSGFAVIGEHLTMHAIDCTRRKLRSLLRECDRKLEGLSIAGEIQQEDAKAVFWP